MAIDFDYRKRAVRQLPAAVGVYILCDLDGVPIYVGQSTDGIRSRVARHLTSARSDIIANRQVDVWEIAFVWAYPVADRSQISSLEARLFHYFNPRSQLMNGSVLPMVDPQAGPPPEPDFVVQVMASDEIAEKKDPAQRLPRQAAHYAQIVGHFLAVKNSTHIARAMNAHFDRLKRYHATLLGIAEDVEGDGGN